MNWWVRSKKISTIVNYTEHFLLLASTITVCISIATFASLGDIPIVVTSSAVGLKTCAITAGTKTYKSIVENRRRNNVEVLTSKAFANSYISHDEFVSVSNVIRVWWDEKRNQKFKNFIV